ncbi:MAG: TlpA family protein disulfide reductase [Planctomycetales bacterium]|nr:TlpA family protein disulfide reductase [Planctomycetales bacterium]
MATVLTAPPNGFAGDWQISLKTPGGALPFKLSIAFDNQKPIAQVFNGAECIDVDVQSINDHVLRLDIAHYDSRLQLELADNGTLLTGHWEKRRSKSDVAVLEAHGVRIVAAEVDAPDEFIGRWQVQFTDEESPAVGIFQKVEENYVAGTFLTTTGDYRYLFGFVRNGQLKLSCFDGAHAFLFTAQLDQTGNLQGEFWSGNWYHDTWEAKRDANASLPSGFEEVHIVQPNNLSSLRFPDLDGKPTDLAQLFSGGSAAVVEIFGSWCPNCHDEAALLTELHEAYNQRGLRVIGLAFELTGNFERDAKQVKRYVERFNVSYPVLIAGLSDKQKASEQLPMLDRIRSFPTTLFVDQSGTVRAVYSGFSGPATGDAHTKLKQQFIDIIERLIMDGGNSAPRG